MRKNDTTSGTRMRWLAGLVGLIALPFVVFTLYVELSRAGGASSLAGDVAAISASVLAGLAFVWLLPIARRVRVLAAIGYAPLVAGLLTFYGFVYLCSVLGRCL